MKPNTKIKDILKACKKAGITTQSGKGSHVKLTAPNGQTFSLSGTQHKETSLGVATKAWQFIQAHTN